MLKKFTLSLAAAIAILVFASTPASAAVRFGVTIRPAPVYTYPSPYVDPYANPYVDPYANSYVDPYAYNYYTAPAPVYTYPTFSFGWGNRHRDFDRDDRGHFRDRDDHGRNSRSGFRGGDRRR